MSPGFIIIAILRQFNSQKSINCIFAIFYIDLEVDNMYHMVVA
nr:MAG TPA: hypothetical protein [Bacteriophage sp.]